MTETEEEQQPLKGNDWEVVHLSASAYAAAPSSKPTKQNEESVVTLHSDLESETSQALFMSHHFFFPPSQHENLPLELEETIVKKPKPDASSDPYLEEFIDSYPETKSLQEEIPFIPIFDNEGNKLPLSKNDEYISDMIENTHNIWDDKGFVVNKSSQVDDDDEKTAKIPYEVWWKRTAATLYSQAKETSTFWSLFIAAAVMGIVVIGHRWQQERAKILQLNWQINFTNERNGKIWGSIYRLKDIIVGGHKRGSLIEGVSGESFL